MQRYTMCVCKKKERKRQRKVFCVSHGFSRQHFHLFEVYLNCCIYLVACNNASECLHCYLHLFSPFSKNIEKGRGCHTLLKPYETNCDLWIWAIQIKFNWLIDWKYMFLGWKGGYDIIPLTLHFEVLWRRVTRRQRAKPIFWYLKSLQSLSLVFQYLKQQTNSGLYNALTQGCSFCSLGLCSFKLLSDMHWTPEIILTFSGGAVRVNTNVRVRASGLSADFLPPVLKYKVCRKSRGDGGSDPLQDSPRANGFVEDISNMGQASISGGKGGATHVEDTNKDIKRGFGYKSRHRCCSAVNKNTWSPQQNQYVTFSLCLMFHPSPEHVRQFCVVVGVSERRLSCCVVHIWKTKSGGRSVWSNYH